MLNFFKKDKLPMTIAEKVQKLKCSFTVEGTPLFMSDRFTKEDIAEMRKNSTAHSSHWLGLTRVWSDSEIEAQIVTFDKMNVISEQEVEQLATSIKKSLSYKDITEDTVRFTKLLTEKVWGDITPLDPDLWRKFGSAPYYISNSNKNLVKLQKKYGACGMMDIFGDRFENGYRMINFISRQVYQLNKEWVDTKAILELKSLTFSSPFSSLEDLEENVVVKNVKEEAQKFYLDKTKNFDDRVTVFAVHGEEETYIYEPNNVNLRTIFKIYYEDAYELDRHSIIIINTNQIVDSWVYDLSKNRCKIDWVNPFHPKLIKTDRIYQPSEEAINRLRRYYMEKLFLEGIASFKFDW